MDIRDANTNSRTLETRRRYWLWGKEGSPCPKSRQPAGIIDFFPLPLPPSHRAQHRPHFELVQAWPHVSGAHQRTLLLTSIGIDLLYSIPGNHDRSLVLIARFFFIFQPRASSSALSLLNFFFWPFITAIALFFLLHSFRNSLSPFPFRPTDLRSHSARKAFDEQLKV